MYIKGSKWRRTLSQSSSQYPRNTLYILCKNTFAKSQDKMRDYQLLLLSALIGCSVGQYGGHHHGYGGGADYGYGGGHHGHGHGHGYASPVIKALPVIPKVAAVAKTVDYYSEPSYSYSYGVNDAYTGDSKSAHETREGDVTKGQYQVLQPDGVLRTVSYVADPIHGFQATVHNSAPAVHAVAKAVVPVAPVIAKAPVYAHGVHGGHGYGHHDGYDRHDGGYHGGYGHAGYGGEAIVHAAPLKVAATPLVKAVAPAYGHGYAGHGHGYDGFEGGHNHLGGHGHGHYGGSPYYGQVQRVSHASGVTHYGGALAAAAPVYAGYGGHHHQSSYDY